VCSFPLWCQLVFRNAFLAWYALKHGVVHIPMLHSKHLNFVRFFAFGGTHTVPNSCNNAQVSVLLVLWSEVEDSLSVFCIMPVHIVSVIILNYKGKVIKLFEMVWSRRWKNGFFVHLHMCLVIDKNLVIHSDFTTYLIYLF